MTDANDLIDALEADPHSEILAAMLTDELMESRGMIRTEADRHVERLRADARERIECAAAAEVMRSTDGRSDRVKEHIRLMCFEGLQPPAYNFIVTGGDSPPVATARQIDSPNGWWHEWTVTVGALWIVAAGGAPRHPAVRRVYRRRQK